MVNIALACTMGAKLTFIYLMVKLFLDYRLECKKIDADVQKALAKANEQSAD